MVKENTPENALRKKYGKNWSVEYLNRDNGGYIVIEDGHGQNEMQQNIKSATPLAKDGMKVELIKQKTIRVDGHKKKIKTRDANVSDAPNTSCTKWEFKYTKDYVRLSKSIGTKAAQAVEQGAEVCLVDIVRTERFSTQEVIDGVYNALHYNKDLKAICIMIESEIYITISRHVFEQGTHIGDIQKMLGR